LISPNVLSAMTASAVNSGASFVTRVSMFIPLTPLEGEIMG
jgi:hypothetical protein